MKLRLFFILLFTMFLISCNKTKEKAQEKEKMIMYQPSEMTILMREMFEFQEKSKKQIENGELPLDFPEKFKKIHTAELSEQFEHDASFQGFTTTYFKNIEDLGNANKANAKQRFNAAINTCIACHQTTCDGPISRIKKLIIK